MRCWGEQFPREDTPWRQLWRYFYHPNYLHLSPNVKRFSSHSKSSKGAPLKALLLPPKKKLQIVNVKNVIFPLACKGSQEKRWKVLEEIPTQESSSVCGNFHRVRKNTLLYISEGENPPSKDFPLLWKKIVPLSPIFPIFPSKRRRVAQIVNDEEVLNCVVDGNSERVWKMLCIFPN